MEYEVLFRTVATGAETQLEEKRSVFIAAVRRVETATAAETFVKERKRAHPDARHTVFAYLLRDGTARYSDDSEPQGTAGQPTLEAIRKTGLVDVCVATTRYFGGILLGAGGLTRAYAAAAHMGLAAAGVIAYTPFTALTLVCNYPDYQRVLQELPKWGARERGADFSDCVTLQVGVCSSAIEAFCRRILDLTAGRCNPVVGETAPDVME